MGQSGLKVGSTRLKSENSPCLWALLCSILEAKIYAKPVQDAFETALAVALFFDSIFLRSWLDFPSQLGSQTPPLWKKNRCQDAFPSSPRFGIDFCSISAPVLDPLDLRNPCFSLGKIRFFRKSPFAINIVLTFHSVTNLPPFWLPKSTKIDSNIALGRHRFFDQFWHRFFYDFWPTEAPSWEPSWTHVGHFFSTRQSQKSDEKLIRFLACFWV